jgi:hypothetical protein
VGHSICHVVECRHGFGPFGELVNGNNDVFVDITIWRVACQELYAPFEEGASCDDGV